MKHKIRTLIEDSLNALAVDGILSAETLPESIAIDKPKREGQGDYASSIALSLAKQAKIKPAELALQIVERLPDADYIEKTEIAGPGFINFFLSSQSLTAIVSEILDQQERYGLGQLSSPQHILVEFVSANPTGPLHVGHGRGAVFGDALARLLRAAGHKVETEYYVNDLGRQMDTLCTSVWIRYLQIHQCHVEFPAAGYRGDYIVDCARALADTRGAELVRSVAGGPAADDECSADEQLTAWIVTAKEQLAAEFEPLREFGLQKMIEVIQADLNALAVHHDQWFYESRVCVRGEVERAIATLEQHGFVYQSEGAAWFRSSEFGDEKDRVLVRSNGDLTYFASDVAYHLDKFDRGYSRMINVWGADHHGYIARIKAALDAAGRDSKRLEILVVQLAALNRGGEKVQMSTRAGEFVTLGELVEETGKDAARFYYLLRKCEQHLDFDLELAKRQSSENPVYYIQYAHARICSVLRQAAQRGIAYAPAAGREYTFAQNLEVNLIKQLARYPEVIQSAARSLEPHQLAYYLRDVANGFHSFYNQERILDSAEPLRSARLNLVASVRQVLANGLDVMGLAAPQSM